MDQLSVMGVISEAQEAGLLVALVDVGHEFDLEVAREANVDLASFVKARQVKIWLGRAGRVYFNHSLGD